MRAVTHFLFSIVCLLFFIPKLQPENIVLFSLIVLFATVFVDIDEPSSWIGKKTVWIAAPISWILGHRGIFHSLILPAIIFLTLHFFSYTEIGIAVVIGYGSHLAMDMLTPHGIYPLYPLQWRIQGPIRVGSLFEKVFVLFLSMSIGITLLFYLL